MVVADAQPGRTPDTPHDLVPALRRSLAIVVFVIGGLSFAFGFVQGWTLGLRLHVPSWSAPLVAPAVDLSVVTLLAAMQYLRAQGVTTRLIGPRLLIGFCGLATLAINVMEPILTRQYGRAAFDAVAPLLLIGWSEVGPGLLAALHRTVPDGPGTSETIKDDRPNPPAELIERAREADAHQRESTGRGITRDRLRAELHISNAVAGELLRTIRSSTPKKGAAHHQWRP